MAAGGFHVLGLRDDGSVIAWGDNVFNQTDVPASVAGAVGVAAGGGSIRR
ncbi:MAG: RCC1 domain-containing protein [Kiritimatiellae bacterium]|nr:RCC1 domain-containing protein [Kiritimatiellia bacterium]